MARPGFRSPSSLVPRAAALLLVLSVPRDLALPEVLKQIRGWVETELLAGPRLSPLGLSPASPQPGFRPWGLPSVTQSAPRLHAGVLTLLSPSASALPMSKDL